MIWLNFVGKIFKLLHSDKTPRHLAAGFALGSIIGLTPLLSLHNLVVFCVIFLLNVSIPAAMFAMVFFELFAYLFDPFFHEIGYTLLVKTEFLRPFWTQLYNMPIAPLTKFYNTVVLGSFVTSLVTLIPIHFAFKYFVIYYRLHLAEKVENLKIVKLVKGSNLFQLVKRVQIKM